MCDHETWLTCRSTIIAGVYVKYGVQGPNLGGGVPMPIEDQIKVSMNFVKEFPLESHETCFLTSGNCYTSM